MKVTEEGRYQRAWETRQEAEAPLREIYDAALARAMVESQESINPAWEIRQKAIALAWATCQKVTSEAFAARERATIQADEEYQSVVDLAWITRQEQEAVALVAYLEAMGPVEAAHGAAVALILDWKTKLRPLPNTTAADLYARLRKAQEYSEMGWGDAASALMAPVVEALAGRFPDGEANRLYEIAWATSRTPVENTKEA